VVNSNVGKIYKFVNQHEGDTSDSILSKTINGLADYVREEKPDLIIVHGDRIESLAAASVSMLNRILLAHVEGGEISGTVDEVIRHAVTKISNRHFTSNKNTRSRLIQLGENPSHVYTIGSPEVDVMISSELPSLDDTKKRYEIEFNNYSLLIYHPVHSELPNLSQHVKEIVDFVLKSEKDFIVIAPNNDEGSSLIEKEFLRFDHSSRIRLLPSMRFEYYLTTLKNADCIIGNSSSGIREAPHYGIPSINIGSRQKNRSNAPTIFNCIPDQASLIQAHIEALKSDRIKSLVFGQGESANAFKQILLTDEFWQGTTEKQFIDN
jgi:UDP-N-acetylglucosamine 2-epimerase (hydrolysing)